MKRKAGTADIVCDDVSRKANRKVEHKHPHSGSDHASLQNGDAVETLEPADTANGRISGYFGDNVFAQEMIDRYSQEYKASTPYRHGVVSNLIDDALLRTVRTEIRDNIHFTPKETDIYKIHQSGDLGNLDGLPASELDKLPSLRKLRDALYSSDFRRWLSEVTGAGALSGTKSDMSVNVYVPGCHLLCHDDVIGTRRVSYILYLTDPDQPWQAEWGGALRLHPMQDRKLSSGETARVPHPYWSKEIPPAWNQLSFFAVQPGESFHDVQEVYRRAPGDDRDDGGRCRMAISGWFHIPQEGEEGYEPGLGEKLAQKSSLHQLQGELDKFDLPQNRWWNLGLKAGTDAEPAEDLSEDDLEFLIKYMNPNYLTPDTVGGLSEMFEEDSVLQLSNFLNDKFATRLRSYLEDDSQHRADGGRFSTSSPPHKARYQYMYPRPAALVPSSLSEDNAFVLVLDDLLPSIAFHKWLSLVTSLTLRDSAFIARRFRRGMDYQLAQAYKGRQPQLEYCLCVTPTTGWGGDEVEDTNADVPEQPKAAGQADKDPKSNGHHEPKAEVEAAEDNVGGYEVYMAGEEDDESDSDAGSNDGVSVPSNIKSQTGAGDRRNAQRAKADPAIYNAAADDEDDGILVSNVASWNTLSIVLRDRGTLRFVKYVSASAKGDRWDFAGRVEVEFDEDEQEEEVGRGKGVEEDAKLLLKDHLDNDVEKEA